MDDKGILVAARKEYTGHLCDILCPYINECFHDMYSEAERISEGAQTMKKFQTLCQEVKSWNNNLIKEHTDKVTQQCSWLGDLIAAIFVCHVKILSSISIGKSSDKLKLKIPTNTSFIHACFVNSAKDIYNNPYIMKNKELSSDEVEEVNQRILTAIENTIRENIPFQEVISRALNNDDRSEEFELPGDDTQEVQDEDVNEEYSENPLGDLHSEDEGEEGETGIEEESTPAPLDDIQPEEEVQPEPEPEPEPSSEPKNLNIHRED